MPKAWRSHRWLVLCGLIVAASPFVLHLAAQGRGGGAGGPRPTINEPTDPMLRGFRWRSIGPVGQGARIDDFAVDEKNPSTFYIGYAVSGVWKTTNNGTSFEQIFGEINHNIADLALAPSDPNILYVATGEANNRQTTSYGNGLWKSTDAGKTFTKSGDFESSQTLGRIIIHPKDPNIAWMAVGGHLYGPNKERGVYMTTDGGKTWAQTLFVDDKTGATEIIVDPVNPLNLWAAMYQRQRTAWGFNGGGPGSGLYASVDGGKTWKKQTGNGLPTGTMGRIALDICRTNPNVLYAQIEVAMDKEAPGSTPVVAPAPATPPAAAAGGGRAGRAGRAGGAAAGGGAAAAGGGAAGAPAAAGAQGGGAGGGGGRGGGGTPNPQFNGIWKSIDHGKTWQYVNPENQRPMYFSQIRVDPNDPNTIYMGGVNAQKSTDGGKTVFSIEGTKGHVDNHAIWIDPLNSKHVMYGDDGGLDVSYDGGETFESIRNMGVGLSYHSSVGMGHPYMVCTGLQDNGSWCGPSSTRGAGIHMWDWMSVGGGDGFQNVIDWQDENVFITESQNAGIQRYDLKTGQTRSIKPQFGGGGGRGGGGGGGGFGAGGGRGNVLNEPPAGAINQFNWNSPILLSTVTHTLYLGGRQLFISHDMGDHWIMTKDMGKPIDLNTRSIMGVSYALPNCSGGGGGGRGGGGGGGAAAAAGAAGAAGGEAAAQQPAPARGGAGVPCINSRHDGYVANEYGSMTEVAESPVLPSVLWAGTDDGNVNISRDGGNTWAEVGHNIPGVNHEYYVSGLEASWFDAGTAYVALDGHRNDDLKPYIFKTTDYGTTWTSISSNLPMANVNSIRQDPVNRNLLFAPMEIGFYVSLNDGKSWSAFMPNLPKGRMDEVMVHPREHDLILSAHGFSVWIMDDITALEQATPEQSADAVLFKPRDAVEWKNDFRGRTETPGEKWWTGENAPRGTAIAYQLKTAATDVKVSVMSTAGEIFSCVGPTAAGLTRFQWAFTSNAAGAGGGGGRGGGGGGGRFGGAPDPNAPAAPAGPMPCGGGAGGGGGRGGGGGGRGGGGGGVGPGTYRVVLTVNGKEAGSQTFRVVEDTWLVGKQE